MHAQPRLFSILVTSNALLVQLLSAQDNPMDDPDLQQLLKQAAATAANNLNQSLNKMNVNGKITRIVFLSTRTDPRQEVELEASREPDTKVTQVEISAPLPKPVIGSE